MTKNCVVPLAQRFITLAQVSFVIYVIHLTFSRQISVTSVLSISEVKKRFQEGGILKIISSDDEGGVICTHVLPPFSHHYITYLICLYIPFTQHM